MVEIVLGAAQLLAGTYFLAVTVAGFYKTTANAIERVLTFIAAMCLITPETVTSIVGLILGVVVLFLNVERAKKSAKTA